MHIFILCELHEMHSKLPSVVLHQEKKMITHALSAVHIQAACFRVSRHELHGQFGSRTLQGCGAGVGKNVPTPIPTSI
jgi:hypothetical protein